jgi:DNA-binding transcriptional LysR family regulator
VGVGQGRSIAGRRRKRAADHERYRAPDRAAIDGVGLAFMSEEQAAPHLASGALVRVLEDWCPPFPGFFLYYPSRRQHPAALTVLIETLRV